MPVFDNPVFEHAARFLAALKQPDFADFSAAAVDAAMGTVFTTSGPNPDWLAQLKSRIQELSFGRTQLEDASPEEFPHRVKSLAASYYRLRGLFQTQLVIMGPFQPPFQFVNGTEFA
jgi:hypothetical protein